MQLLKGCHDEFGAVPPNNIINDSRSVKDILEYYENLRKPYIIPEVLEFLKEKLPSNLTFEAPLPFRQAKRKFNTSAKSSN